MFESKTNKDKLQNSQNWLIIICLVVAGELIFGLPFHIARFYRPTLLNVFNISNTELAMPLPFMVLQPCFLISPVE